MKNLTILFTKISRYTILLCFLMIPLHTIAQSGNLEALLSNARSQGIEDAQLRELQNRAEGRGISEQELIRILEPAVELARENLPSEMILQKALEGFSKGVSGSRLIPILQNMQAATRKAATVVNAWVEKPEVANMMRRGGGEEYRNELIKTVSRGVTKGISAETYSDLLEEVESEGLLAKTTPTTVIAATTVLSGLDMAVKKPRAARGFVVRSLKAGFSTSELQKLPAAMKIAQQRSQLPAANVIEGISRQLDAGVPARQVLQNLFDGKVGGGPPGGTPPGLENKQNRGRGHGNNGNNS